MFTVADPRHNESLQAWICSKLKVGKLCDDHYQTAAVVSGTVDNPGKLLAGIIYHDFTPHSLMFTFASNGDGWASRRVLSDLFSYPFEQLGLERVGAVCSKKNRRARKVIEKVGFRVEGCGRKAFYDGSDAVYYGMLKEECKWI